MLEINDLKKKFGKNITQNENLSKYSWFNLGGPAELFFRPENKEQLKNFLKEVKKQDTSINILGAGSNTLIRDTGVKGIIIKLSSKFSNIKLIEKNIIEVGAAALDKNVANFAKDNEIAGMEFLSCIPGSIGGAIVMNSGCYGTEISEKLLSIVVIDDEGNEKKINREDIEFYYRGSNLPNNYIIISAQLKGVLTPKDVIEKKQNDYISKKKDSQPSRAKTGGSTFKNNKNKKAWKLIKESGCDKFAVGDAKISEKHCNFLVNSGKAKSSDIEKLIDKVKSQVHLKTGINLELEIKIIGDEE